MSSLEFKKTARTSKQFPADTTMIPRRRGGMHLYIKMTGILVLPFSSLKAVWFSIENVHSAGILAVLFTGLSRKRL